MALKHLLGFLGFAGSIVIAYHEGHSTETKFPIDENLSWQGIIHPLKPYETSAGGFSVRYDDLGSFGIRGPNLYSSKPNGKKFICPLKQDPLGKPIFEPCYDPDNKKDLARYVTGEAPAITPQKKEPTEINRALKAIEEYRKNTQ